MAGIAAFPDPGPRDEFGAAPPALFRHRLLQRENARFLGQKMRIMEIAMIHVRHLIFMYDRGVPDPAKPLLGVLAHDGLLMLKKTAPSADRLALTKPGEQPGCDSAPKASAL